MGSLPADGLLRYGRRGYAGVDREDDEVEDDGSQHEDGVRATALAKLAYDVVVDLTEHFLFLSLVALDTVNLVTRPSTDSELAPYT